jgi:DNA-binding NarL/FixJ family response regulator
MSRYRIALADDHVLLRQGLRRIVAEAPELEVVGEAGDGMELLQLLNRIVPDMVVLDISMPKMRGLEAIREIKSRLPRVKVLILTMHRDPEYLRQAIASSADGYLLKEDADTELFRAIQKIRDNGFYTSPSLAKEAAELGKATCRAEVGRSFDREGLTTREREVLKLIAEGKSSRQVAELLCISVRTVDHHRASIMDKLELKNTADLVKYAINRGYIEIIPHRRA